MQEESKKGEVNMNISGNISGLASAGGSKSALQTEKDGVQGEIEDLKSQQAQDEQDDSSSQVETASGGGQTEEVSTPSPTKSKDTSIQSKIDEEQLKFQQLDAQIAQMRDSEKTGLEKEKNKNSISGSAV